ncbi:carbohydrate binding family 9 domain-containing protein [Chloracidobacterium aggregatum]|uniref:carbohydrate binding family 9 domain-containing protein n=1 Tax=Chloracidobacterium aggregatum TaxID=2851959 RepID=UPI001B8BDDF7|nr:carbohydrate binding family 9 domain-containing protein [Chloracidobacterium aggregatum]QUV91770.1 carbohydrate binding family 9 domain-containing protein [Chloracidobacterium sp. A]QUV96059.1 carbohydrate binding family 9 domain-containing protein [Chloracidobacterium sp. E]
MKQRAVVTNTLLMRIAHVVSLCRPGWVWQKPARIRGLMAFGLVVWMAWGDSAARAQNVAIESRPSIRITRTDEAITIDGRLDEPAWETAEVIRDFRQQEPVEGAPPTEKTECRLLYDKTYVYIGIRCFDSEPDKINARDLNRDSSFGNDDKLVVLLDTYRDGRNAYRFSVNPLGTQSDALITDEGRDFNLAWDTQWLSGASRDQEGWSAEMAIPLVSLRFRKGADTWGFNVSRIIRRKNEILLWTSWQRAFGLLRVSQAGVLTGVEGITRSRLVEIKPYVTGRLRQNVPDPLGNRFEPRFSGTVGVEVARVGITPSVTAELTVNPDFGQAEVDQQVVNLTRFSVFFPERRDFFLENAGIFLFGRPGVNQMFFTRRIGLTDDGAPLPIDFGAKVTGKAGKWNLGFLHVETRPLREVQPDGTERVAVPRERFTVARVKRDVGTRSNVGAIALNRQGGEGRPYNRGVGLDAQINFNDYWTSYAFFAKTFSPGLRGDTTTFRVQSGYDTNQMRLFGVYEEIGRNYNPEVGFVLRRDVRQYFGDGAYKWRPSAVAGTIREIRFEGFGEYYQDRTTGDLQTRTVATAISVDFANSASATIRPWRTETDVLTRPFRIRPGIVIPPGSYTFNRHGASFGTNRSRRIVFDAGGSWGSFYSGQRQEASAGLTWRPDSHLSLEASHSFNAVQLPQGDFSTSLFNGRVTYNFSRKWLSTCLVQVNSAARLTSINARVRYIYRPNSDIFFIYNQTTGVGVERPNRQFQIKVTYDFIR